MGRHIFIIQQESRYCKIRHDSNESPLAQFLCVGKQLFLKVTWWQWWWPRVPVLYVHWLHWSWLWGTVRSRFGATSDLISSSSNTSTFSENSSVCVHEHTHMRAHAYVCVSASLPLCVCMHARSCWALRLFILHFLTGWWSDTVTVLLTA